MEFEESIARTLLSCEPRTAKGVAIELIRCDYDADTLVNSAKKHNVEQRLGFLADIAGRAAQKHHLDEPSSKALSLANKLFAEPSTWHYLIPTLPAWGKEFIAGRSTGALNRKWKVYSSLTPEELSDWVDLYITGEYASVRR